MEHYRTALDHLHRAMDAAVAADDLLLVANIAYPIDLVSRAILSTQSNGLAAVGGSNDNDGMKAI